MSSRILRRLACVVGLLAVAPWSAAPVAAQGFLPDERVTSLMVRVKTMDETWASTLNKVYFSVSSTREWRLNIPFPEEGWADFMRGSQTDYWLSPGTMTVENIRYIRIRKEIPFIDDKWGFGWLAVYVNGKLLYDSGTVDEWLEDGNHDWRAPDFTPVTWPPLALTTPGLPDTGPNTNYSTTVRAEGGRGPYTWTASCTYHDGQWTTGPSAAVASPSTGRVTGRTADREGDTGILVRVRDSLGTTTQRTYMINVVRTLGPPNISSFAPNYGWPAAPSGIDATRVTIRGYNFDSRAAGNTTVEFNGARATVESVSNTQIIAVVPASATDGPITVTTPSGSDSTAPSNFNVHPYGYRWNLGYSFPNAGTTELSWDIFRDLFGSSQVERMTPFGLVPDPLAGIFYLAAFKGYADGGNCHGYSLSSLRFQHEEAYLSQYQPSGADSLWELDSALNASDTEVDSGKRLGRLINLNQGAHTGLESMMHDALNNRADDPVRLLAEVRAQLAAGTEGQIHITSNTGGHSLLPYAIEDRPDGTSLIRVYDSNKPFRGSEGSDGDSALVVNRNNNTWSYPFNATSTWSGPHLDAAPYSVYPTPPTLVTDAISDILFFGLPGDAKVTQLSDDAGHTFFTPTGQVNENPATRLPRATKLGPLWEPPPTLPDAFFVAPHPTTKVLPVLTAEIAGTAGKGDSRYMAALLTSGTAYTFSNVRAAPGLRDRVEFQAKSHEASLTPAGVQDELWADVIQRDLTDAGVQKPGKRPIRTYTLSKATLPAGGRLLLKSDPAKSSVSVSVLGSAPARFTLLREVLNDEDRVRHVVGDFTVAAGATHTFELPLLGQPRQTIDKDSNGKPETQKDLSPVLIPLAVKYGDANRDGDVTPVDAALGLRFAGSFQTPDSDQTLRCDVYPRAGVGARPVGDGRLTVEDAIEILRVVVGLSAPLGSTDDAFSRPASYPRLPDPLPPSPPAEDRPATYMRIVDVVFPPAITIPDVILIPPLTAVTPVP